MIHQSMAAHLCQLLLFFFLLCIFLNPPSNRVLAAGLILEDGYTVTTVLDGHKLKLNPHLVLPRPRSSDLILLDYSNSTFYTVSFPISQESVINRLSGDGVAGFSDGELGLARFNKPRSFTVDNRGNVYVADRSNGAIRRITNSGVTTIAGGYSKGVLGHQDGPAQNATFSSDFDVAFVAQECALLISDHGNQLIRRLYMKPEDCASGSESALGTVSFWILGLASVFSGLIGIAIGLVVRPYIMSREGSSPLLCSKTWRLYLTNLAKPILMLFLDSRSAVAKFKPYELLRRLLWLSLSHLSLMFRINNVGSQTSTKGMDSQTSKGSASLLDSDINSFEMETSQVTELRGSLSFDSSLVLSNSEGEISDIGEQDHLGGDLLSDGNQKIDTLIRANIMGFSKAAEETKTSLDVTFVESRGLVKRR